MKFFSYLVSNTIKYDFRAFVLNSFFVQCLLVVNAPFRKSSSTPDFHQSVWFLYLISDWASSFGVGLIPVNKDHTVDDKSGILLLWAPFLLLHLGSIGSITAFTSSDNELWSRYAIQLATMIYAILNAFYGSFTSSLLRVPFLLIFLAGFSRFLERILCLSQARFSSMKDSLLNQQRKKTKPSKKPLQIYDVEEEELAAATTHNTNENELSDADILRHAYRLFESFKSLFVGLNIDSSDKAKSREYFRSQSVGNAFTIVEIELNFAYDMFYTKALVMQQWLGRVLHPISIICQVIALLIWHRTKKDNFDGNDVVATYILLVGALARDFISLSLAAFSDWTLASVARKPASFGSKLASTCLFLRKRRWGDDWSEKKLPYSIKLSKILFSRWSESISQLNLIDEVYRNSFGVRYKLKRIDKGFEALGLDYVLRKVWDTPLVWFDNNLRDFIFRELKDNVGTGTSRGQWALEKYTQGVLSNNWITMKSFDESLILWHIATTLCYYTEEEETFKENQYCDTSMILSEYMMFVLHCRPEMMVEVAAMGEMRYEATETKAKSYFSAVGGCGHSRKNDKDMLFLKPACRELLISEACDGQDEGYSVFYEACRLAKELKDLNERQVIEMWEVVAKVWEEMLSYAAARCSPSAHVTELAYGGQLLTLVWLLIQHFGLAK